MKTLINNNISDYGIFISCGLILGCSVYYLIKSNYTTILPKNTNIEALTKEESEAIVNENAVNISNANIEDVLTDSDTETDYLGISDYDSASSTDFDEIVTDPEIYCMPYVPSMYNPEEFIMPDVDFDVCPIEELKLFEFCSLFSKEMAEHSISEEDMIELIAIFPKEDLATNWINDLLLSIIKLL